MNQLKKIFFFYFKQSLFFYFSKNTNPRLYILFLVDKSNVNNEHRAMRKKLQKQSFADILQSGCS